MNIETFSSAFALITAVVSGSWAAIQAGLGWREKARDTRRQSIERRMEELRRLIARREEVQPILDDIFDYLSSLDQHLRVKDLTFKPEETETRARADRAFEHFREVHRSVAMGLIETGDLGPWIYWIHRVPLRTTLSEYSRACGYDAFMDDLEAWTKDSRELQLLKEHSPWWNEDRASGSRPIQRDVA